MPWLQRAAILLAAFAAGSINAVAGGGTLISFPTLLYLGRNPIVANASNAMGLVPGSIAGAVGFRRELKGGRRWVMALGVPTVLGAVVGAVVLVHTKASTFAALVPFLILVATVLLAVQSPVARLVGRTANDAGEPSRAWWAGAMVFQFLVATYGAYFGGGQGILLLAALGILGMRDIHQMNGVKNVLTVAINGIAAAYFAVAGKVNWSDALLLAIGSSLGAYGGAGLARRLGRTFVRRAVVVIGVAMAVATFLRAHHF